MRGLRGNRNPRCGKSRDLSREGKISICKLIWLKDRIKLGTRGVEVEILLIYYIENFVREGGRQRKGRDRWKFLGILLRKSSREIIANYRYLEKFPGRKKREGWSMEEESMVTGNDRYPYSLLNDSLSTISGCIMGITAETGGAASPEIRARLPRALLITGVTGLSIKGTGISVDS